MRRVIFDEIGRFELGPDDGTLTVRTGKAGAAAKAGHNLRIEVTSWRGLIDLPSDPDARSVTLSADPRSLVVREGTGGMQALGDDDKTNIKQTIDDEVLKGNEIQFRSSDVKVGEDGRTLAVSGELELNGGRHPVEFELSAGDDRQVVATARIAQTDFGMKPYSALFGTLKVVDVVEVTVQAVSRPRPLIHDPPSPRRISGSARRPSTDVAQSRYTVCASRPPSTPGGRAPVPWAYSASSAIVRAASGPRRR